MAKVRLFYRRKICYWLIVSVMILMTLNPSLQVIAKESVSDDLTVYTDAGESLELYARSAVLMDGDSGRILFEKNWIRSTSYGEYNEDHDVYSCSRSI